MSEPRLNSEPIAAAAGKSASPVVLRAGSLSKIYRRGTTELALFRDLDLHVRQGEMVAIVGESGAGKSSLLHLLAALDRPTSGEVWVGDQQLSRLNNRQAADLRNRRIGYVWQFHYLLPEFTAVENVAMPLLARGINRASALRSARIWLAEVELSGREEHRSGELSGGEQQRVSLARALVTEPSVLLADEPTGDLDQRTAGVVFDLMQRLHTEHRLASVLVTHNLDLAARCHRVLRLSAGQLTAETRA